MKKECCYIAGPLSFTEIHINIINRQMFIRCEEFLKEKFPKWTLLNPVRWETKTKWYNNLHRDIEVILINKPKHIVLLPHWEFSQGAKTEVSLCRLLFKSNVYLFEYNYIETHDHLVKLKNFKISFNYDFDKLFR